MADELSFTTGTHGVVRVKPDHLVFAAFASRDPAAAEHHRAELAERGISVPDSIPCFYRGVTGTLSQAATIATFRHRLLPEVEFAVIRTPSLRLVTVGCDLYDEEVEHTDIERSKAVCATPIAPAALALDGLGPTWDTFRIWMRCDGQLLQDGLVEELMAPAELVAQGLDGTGRQGQAVVYSGTLPLLGPIGTHLSEIEIGLDGGTPERKIVHRFRLV